MKKYLLSFFALLFTVTVYADEASFDFTNPEALTPSITPTTEESQGVSVQDETFTNNGVSISFEGTGNATLVFTGAASTDYAKELRFYKNNTMTISAPEGKVITAIRVAGSNLTTTYLSTADRTWTTGEWTGSAQSVALSCIKSTVKISTITVTFGEAGSSEPGGGDTPEGPVEERTTIYSATLLGSQADFTIENKTLPEGVTAVWSNDANYGMKASAYINNTKHATESWLLSPEIDLTGATEGQLTFEEAANHFSSTENFLAACAVKVKETGAADWSDLTLGETRATGTSFTYKQATADLSAYSDKKIQFAFVYTSTADVAGTWEIKNFEVTALGGTATEPVEPEVPVYTSLAGIKAAATTTATACKLEVTDLLVTGIGKKGSNYNVFVTDGTEGFLLYGTAEPTFAVGDKISGTLKGTIQLYKNLSELSGIDYSGVSVASSNNEGSPVTVNVEDSNSSESKTDESRLVRLENVSFTTDALSGSNITLTDEVDNEIVLRDNFGVLSDYVFRTDKTYNVNAFLVYYDTTPQLYPLSADDVELITNLLPPETAWEKDEVAILKGEAWTVDNTLHTLSDATPVYTSSNENVATVAADGTISVTGYGHTVITVETAETDNYSDSRASFDLYIIEGEGTLAAPYSVADVFYFNGKLEGKAWVKGVLSGYFNNNKYLTGTEGAVASNIALSQGDLAIPVALPNGSDVRAALNLMDNPTLLNSTIWVYGTLENYFNQAGVKNTSDASFDGNTTTGISEVLTNANNAEIFTIDGRKATGKLAKGLYIVGGKKMILK